MKHPRIDAVKIVAQTLIGAVGDVVAMSMPTDARFRLALKMWMGAGALDAIHVANQFGKGFSLAHAFYGVGMSEYHIARHERGQMMKIAVHAVDGKMGQAIVRLIAAHDGLTLGSGFVRSGHAWSGEPVSQLIGADVGSARATSNHDQFCAASDVVVDFTRPEATLALLPVCRKQRKPLMIGTTGFNAEAKKWIADAARDIPVILAANTSVGVNVLLEVSRQVAKALPFSDWNVDVLDIHHKHKDDAPSGTALRLAEAIAEAQETDLSARMVYPYQRRRGADDVGFAVLRSGEVVGEHTVYFTSAHERIELTHCASDRVIFAQGALQAAAWLVDQPPGLYSMADVLGFSA